MQLKIIIVPTLVIFALILAIGFIKPDYDTLLQKRSFLVTKKAEADKIETVKTNIGALSSEIESKSELEQWSLRYYPETMDQERIIDSFNFMALQSGLVIKSMEMKEIVASKKEVVDVGGPLTSIPGAATDDKSLLVSSYQPPTPNSYVAQVKAKGSYENLKNFMDRLSRMDRMNSLRLMSINVDTESKEATDTEQVVAATDQLMGTFEARFDHVKSPTQQNALGIPVFEQSTLITSGLEEAKSWATSAVPVLSVDQTGRANPFQ